GMIRSTPSWSGSGNITPASMRIVVSSHDTAIMFMPNSPTPPSGMTSSVAGDTSGTADWFIPSPAHSGRITTAPTYDLHARYWTKRIAGRVPGGTIVARSSGRWEDLDP